MRSKCPHLQPPKPPKDKRKVKVRFKQEIRYVNGQKVIIKHPLPPEEPQKETRYTNKGKYIKIARELHYPKEIIDRLRKAKSEDEADRIMIDGRHWLDRFD